VNVTIIDDEPALPYLYANYPKVIEANAGAVTINVSRSGDLSEPTTLDYFTADGSAVAGQDYVPASGSLTFAPNEDSKTFTVTVIADNVKEPVEQFNIVFTNIVGALPADSFASTVTIYDPVPLVVDPTFDPGVGADGLVYDLLPQANGKIYALGSFTNIGGFTRPFVARLNANGSVDKHFTAGQDKGGFDSGLGQLVPLSNGDLLACGTFTNIAGTQQPSLARLTEDGSLDRSFHPTIDGPVSRVAMQPDGKMLILGQFTHVNGVARNYIARLNSKGQLDATFNAGAGPDWPPAAIALEPNGKVLVGGAFSTWSGVSRRAAARLLPNGQLDPTYDLKIDDYAPYFYPYVTKFIVRPDGSHFLVGLSLYQVSGTYLAGTPALVNSDGTCDPTFDNLNNWLFANIPPSAAELQTDGRLLVSGAFGFYNPIDPSQTIANGDSFSLWRLNPNGSLDLSIDPLNFPVDLSGFGQTPGALSDVSVQADGRILIAGDFTQVSGVPRKGMARIIAP
jgi:uncharacterized delta-60 repeat protein